MEYHTFLSFPILSTFILFVIMALKIWKKSKTTISSHQNLPPGPRKLPIIGNMHHLFGDMPHRRLSDLAKNYGPIMQLQLGEVTNIIISSPETGKQVMKTHDITFADRPFLLAASIVFGNKDIAFAPYGDYWRQIRKIGTLELLSAKRVKSFRSVREEELAKLIGCIHRRAGLPINLTSMLLSANYSIISRAAFGKIWNGQDIFMPLVKRFIDVLAGFSLPDLYPSVKRLHQISGTRRSAEKIHQDLDKIMEDIINQHLRKSSVIETGLDGDKDLVDVLLYLQKQGDLEFPLSTDSIKAVILDMFIAGTETSSTALEWTMSELMRNPEVMEMAQAEVRRVFGENGEVEETRLDELNYIRSIIKETLRLHPPVPLLPRACREKCKIDGYDIPAKSKVIVNAWAIARDANNWVEAEKFIPERFLDGSIDYNGNNFEFTPFGAGRRMCPGLLFGTVSVEYTLAQLLYHFDWKLPNEMTPEELDMTELFGLILQRKNDLMLVPIPYIPHHA